MKDPKEQAKLEQTLESALPEVPEYSTHIKETWQKLRNVTYNMASKVLGYVIWKHQDWFDENEPGIDLLLETMHITHKSYILEKKSAVIPSGQTNSTNLIKANIEPLVEVEECGTDKCKTDRRQLTSMT
ncbi:unnamed protein product [Caretta caretta]